MRQIGTLSSAQEAARFTAYLITQGIPTREEESDGKWEVWVRDEDQLAAARTSLAEFQADPGHARFQGVEQAAEELKRAEAAQREATRKNVIAMGQRWGGPIRGRRRPLTLAVILVCCLLGVFTNMGAEKTSMGHLMFCNPEHLASVPWPHRFADKLMDVRAGQVWRLLTPALLHYGAMHLAFNMMMFYQLASLIEYRRGSLRLAFLLIAIALPSNLAQALAPDRFGGSVSFAGLSGVVFGLLGYAWMKSRHEPALGIYINRGTLTMAVIFLVLGFAGAFDIGNVRIANWAHGIGFAAGIVIGYAPTFRQQLRS